MGCRSTPVHREHDFTQIQRSILALIWHGSLRCVSRIQSCSTLTVYSTTKKHSSIVDYKSRASLSSAQQTSNSESQFNMVDPSFRQRRPSMNTNNTTADREKDRDMARERDMIPQGPPIHISRTLPPTPITANFSTTTAPPTTDDPTMATSNNIDSIIAGDNTARRIIVDTSKRPKIPEFESMRTRSTTPITIRMSSVIVVELEALMEWVLEEVAIPTYLVREIQVQQWNWLISYIHLVKRTLRLIF
ncbi:unnamed protein product [Ambrosiozyma monospora]|uniref:Unnamed protein product n=1 Tax=Ambrosiozyma monospora TaxID=43982 RepID=A0ACB5UB69_AMBMO|nr:unnamed protein product [Ambrosiozyma monospora]